MDSKLPKPSGLKRPAFKTTLPTLRIRPMLGNASLSTTQPPPLSRDLANIPETMHRRRERGGSPDVQPRVFESRARLRRSKSACDIRNMRAPMKRTESNLVTVPAKAPRLMSNTTSVASAFDNNRPTSSATSTGIIKRTAATFNSVKNSSNINTKVTTRAPIGRTAVQQKTSNATSTTASVSTTGAGKTINKRIPPYDYKARFNDLLPKFKSQKEKCEELMEKMKNMENIAEQFETSQADLIASQVELKHSKTEKDCLQRQIDSQNIKLHAVAKSLSQVQDDYAQIKKLYEALKLQHETMSNETLELREQNKYLTENNAKLLEENAIIREELFRSNLERKELHNTVMDLRGNIRVFCRVRPPLPEEQEKMLCLWNYIDEATLEVQTLDTNARNKSGPHNFSFDYVFHPHSRQEDVFEMVSPLIQSALDGYNICIFAYGQTGSGKTFTMDGIDSNAGVIPRSVELLFTAVKNYKRLGWEYEIKVTFLEIYNEVLYDLLSNEQKDMEIRMVKNNKNDIYVSNITEVMVESANHLRELMQIAKMNRATASTAGNERSSRSHAVTKIELIGRHEEKKEMSIGTINLVDLAGSESPKTSLRMNETKNINRSLAELKNVILALLQKQDHIPYRNSKLTHLLMPSLGGNSKTLMFINVSPFQDCYVESVNSLRFAANVNSCKMAKAKRQRFLNTSNTAGSV